MIEMVLDGYCLQNRVTVAKIVTRLPEIVTDYGSIRTHRFYDFLQWELTQALILIPAHPNRP
jgi:hypothetical protein